MYIVFYWLKQLVWMILGWTLSIVTLYFNLKTLIDDLHSIIGFILFFVLLFIPVIILFANVQAILRYIKHFIKNINNKKYNYKTDTKTTKGENRICIMVTILIAIIISVYLFISHIPQSKEYISAGFLHLDKEGTCLAISPDKSFMVTGSYTGTAKIWDIQSGKCLETIISDIYPITSVGISTDGNLIAICRDNMKMDFTDEKVNFATIPKIIGTHYNENGVIFWNRISKSIETISQSDNFFSINKNIVKFSPDGNWIAYASKENISFFPLNKNMEKFDLSVEGSKINCIQFGKSGKYIAASECGIIYLWDMETRKNIYKVHRHERDINSISISNDDKYIASCSDDGTVKVWSLIAPNICYTYKTRYLISPDKFTYVFFLADNKHFICVSSNMDRIYILDVKAQPVAVLKDVSISDIISLDLSIDGKCIICGDYSGNYKVWQKK
jgi:WD40 repeat protein